MSSMRNAVQRRQHRERGQLEGREKWGILEKHKDYSLRAKDYNNKKAKLKRLEEKARDRNPDEFHFGMMGGRNGKQGRHGQGTIGRDSATARGLGHDAIKLLKTQDKGYLRTVGERIRREIDRLEREVQLQNGMNESLGEKNQPKEVEHDEFDGFDDDLDEIDFNTPPQPNKSRKVVFADDKGNQSAMKKQRTSGEDDEPMEDKDEFTPAKPRRAQKQIALQKQASADVRRARQLRERTAEARQHKLTALRKQFGEIEAAETELDWQRGKMDNSVGGKNKHGIKWKIRERKR